MKKEKGKFGGIIICLFELIVGVLLLINPKQFTSIIVIIAGVVLAVVGALSVVKYFRTEIEKASIGQPLAKGLGALLFGGFCIFKSQLFVEAFYLLSIVYSIVLIAIGLGKIQLTADMLRKNNKKWYFAAIAALIATVCGLIILFVSFKTANVLWMFTFTGIALIVEAVLDVLAVFADKVNKDNKDDKDDKESKD